MTRHPLIKAFALTLAVMFLTVQGFALAHTTANGAEHSHDGVVCDVALVSVEQVVVTPPVETPAPAIIFAACDWDSVPTSVAPKAFDGRAPPPRGPPAL